MLSLLIQFITKQEMPLFGNVDEVDESIKRSHYVVRTIGMNGAKLHTKIQSNINIGI